VSAAPPAAPLILTVALPDALQRQADAVRSAHAPAAARRAPAHLTLFRHLPGPALAEIGNSLRRIVVEPAPALVLQEPTAWDGRWVVPVRAPALDALRAELADQWHGLLAPGDHAPPRLHISLSRGREPPPPLGQGPWKARGLLLWRHAGATARPPAERGGPFWTPLVAFAFHG
jgi:hypothetical protein